MWPDALRRQRTGNARHDGKRAHKRRPVTVESYYADQANITCNPATSCSLFFARIPMGKWVFLRRVTCQLLFGGEVLRINLTTSANGSTVNFSRMDGLIPVHVAFSAFHYYTVNQDTQFVFAQRAYPAVYAVATPSAEMTFTCRIVGEISSIP